MAHAHERETEGLARETATSEILRVIASSPTDLESVLDTVAENAARFCSAGSASIYRLEGDFLQQPTAVYGPVQPLTQPVGRGSVTRRAVLDRRVTLARREGRPRASKQARLSYCNAAAPAETVSPEDRKDPARWSLKRTEERVALLQALE